jgi:hypothetical protein
VELAGLWVKVWDWVKGDGFLGVERESSKFFHILVVGCIYL